MYVSFDAQYQFIQAQKGARAASLIEAAMLDAGMVILSALGIGLARAGKPSGGVRLLIVICAAVSAGMNFAAADPASWRSMVAYVAAPVFLAVITDRVIAVIRQHVLPLDTGSAWAPLGRAAVAALRLAAVMALYLLRTVLAPSSTVRGLRQIVLDAAPVPAMARERQARGEPLPGETDGHDTGQLVTGFRTKKRFPVLLPESSRVREPFGCRAGRRRARTARRPAGGHRAHLHRRGIPQAYRPDHPPRPGRGIR